VNRWAVFALTRKYTVRVSERPCFSQNLACIASGKSSEQAFLHGAQCIATRPAAMACRDIEKASRSSESGSEGSRDSRRYSVIKKLNT
jgi:hypothetical protein